MMSAGSRGAPADAAASAVEDTAAGKPPTAETTSSRHSNLAREIENNPTAADLEALAPNDEQACDESQKAETKGAPEPNDVSNKFSEPVSAASARVGDRRCCQSCWHCLSRPQRWPREIASFTVIQPVSYVRKTAKAFGWPFLLYLTSNYFCLKGFSAMATSKAALPYFKDYLNVSAEKYQQALLIFRQTPFSIKGVMGAVSDSYAWMGYHKR